MFDIAPSEMLIVALVAIVLIGPKDLPRVMRVVGQWVGKGRAMARHFRGAVDELIRESELQEMEQKWKAENERIMREHAAMVGGVTAATTPALAAPAGTPAADAAPATDAHPAAEAHSPAVAPLVEAPAPADLPRQG